MDLLVPQPRPKESNREYACRVLRMNIMTFRLKPGEPLSENRDCQAVPDEPYPGA